MRVHYYQEKELQENRVEVYYNREDAEIQNLKVFLDNQNVIVGSRDHTSKRMLPGEIYYIEIVDRHCFAYLEEEVFQIEQSLRTFLDEYEAFGFIQIGKSTIVNINHVNQIVPDFNMRMHLILENGCE